MRNVKVYEGVVEENPWGNWSDVDKGIYIDGERVAREGWNVFSDYEGKRVRVTIEELPPEPNSDSDD